MPDLAKRTVKTISFHRAEGSSAECAKTYIFEGPDAWVKVQAHIFDAARTAPEGGGYHKCEYKIVWGNADGDLTGEPHEYNGSLDLSYEYRSTTEFKIYVREIVVFYAGKGAAHMDEQRYANYLREYVKPATKAAYNIFLEECSFE